MGGLAGLAVLGCAGEARAQAHERRFHLGGSVGYGSLWGGPTSAGVVARVNAAYELSDMFNLMGAADVGTYPYGQWVLASGTVGAGYVVDSFQWVPYVGAMAGPAALLSTDSFCGLSISAPCRAFRLVLEIPFGLDYQLTRRFTVGVGGRFQMILLGESPWMTLAVQAKAEYVWGR